MFRLGIARIATSALQYSRASISSTVRGFSQSASILNKKEVDLFDHLIKYSSRESQGTKTPSNNSGKVPHEELAAILRDSSKSFDRKRPSIPEHGVSKDIVDIDWSVLGGVSQSDLKRTGILASRSVFVEGGAGGLQVALRRLNSANTFNKIRRTVNRQRYHEKPGKKKARLRQEKQRRQFDTEIRRLFALVSEARRKGY